VIEFTREGGINLRTPRAPVRASRMILAVNGFASKFGFWQRHLLPFSAHASLTRPLTDGEHRALGGVEPWGVTPVNAFVSTTMRYTTDRRIMIRYLLRYCPSQRAPQGELEEVRAAHAKVLRGRFPMLPDVTIDHSWSGYVCLSRNNAPGFGRLEDNIWSAVCGNAVGITKATIAGMLAADLACDVDNPLIDDMNDLGKPQALPPRPILDLGVRIRNSWDMWRGSDEY
jgi:glycine/D-amino acid oxidase-like deaminating enzyme